MKTLKFIFLFSFSLNMYAQETLTLSVNLQEDVEDNVISIYRKTSEFPHFVHKVYKFELEFGLNEMEIDLIEGEYLLKSFNPFEGSEYFMDAITGELNWTISNNFQDIIFAQGIEGNSEFSICYSGDCLLECDYTWEPVCVDNTITYGNECLANKDGVYTYTTGVCNNNLYNTAFVGIEFDQSIYLGHDNSAQDGFAIQLFMVYQNGGLTPSFDLFPELEWLSYSLGNDCEVNSTFEDLNQDGYIVQVCGQGIPTENDVGESYIWVNHVDPWTQTTTYIPRRFQVFALDTCSDLQTYIDEINATILPANITLNQGWNMFGYVCYQPQDVQQLFESIEDEIVIVKDNLGTVYIPEWDFNGIGELNYAEGYQIKVISQIGSFSLCENSISLPVVNGCTDCAALNYNPIATYESGNCIYDLNGDGIIDD